MGFVVTTLGPADQDLVKGLETEIMTTLAKAKTKLQSGEGTPQCDRWFGDSTPGFQAGLALKIGRMRSVLNVISIPFGFCPLHERDVDINAAAYEPSGGWGDYTNLTAATGETFKMEIDLNFSSLPRYSYPNPATTTGQSQFETIIHELSHIVLGTEDQRLASDVRAYGGDNARLLVTQNPSAAQCNAENWGLFIEEFR